MIPVPARASPLNVAVLGAGVMGQRHARVFAQMHGSFTLAGVYDPSAEAASAAARTWSVRVCRDEVDAILAADLVVVASPIDAHAGAASRALARGRHVLVEKPVCATARQAFALARSVGRAQRLFVGHSERFNPVIRALRDLVAPYDVRTIRLRRTAIAERPGREHGALVSLGVHDLDLLAHLTGSTVALREVVHADDDRADLVLSAGSGATGWVHVDRRARRRERTIEVTTTDAVYVGDLLACTLFVERDGQSVPCPLADEEPLVAQAASIARALHGSHEPVANGVDGARALSLALEAMDQKRPARELATRV